jgi:methylated-DNA-[protein]-cysteine S-methyltransferase
VVKRRGPQPIYPAHVGEILLVNFENEDSLKGSTASRSSRPRSSAAKPSPKSAHMATDSTWNAKMKAPFAVLGVRTARGVVTNIAYLPNAERAKAPDNALAERAVRELERYLDDPEFRFALPLAAADTPFRERVRRALSGIPVGESRTYGELARALHTAPRAVGGACGANDIALVVPCHRVVGSLGSLGGFMHAVKGDPLAIKRWLLTHEGYRFGA